MPIVLQLVAMIGIGALVYPSAADWFSTIQHRSEVSGYTRELAATSPEQRQAALDAARSYNDQLPEGLLLDPYSADSDGEPADAATYAEYERVLRLAGTRVIGELSYPRLGIGLPIFHGTGEDALTSGVGHLYGSSLPVGGPSTHSVLTSHSGLVHAALFTRLPQARVGDTFEIRVLGENHSYEVDDIETVEPYVTESLRVAEGEDRVTLLTCTPIGVNSHRLLVHAHRVSAPAGDGDRALAGDGLPAGFPWWALIFIGASGAVAYALFAPRRPSRATRASAGRGARNTSDFTQTNEGDHP